MRSRFSIPQQPRAIYSRLGAGLGFFLVVAGLWLRHQPGADRSLSHSARREQTKSLAYSRWLAPGTDSNPSRSGSNEHSTRWPTEPRSNVSKPEAFDLGSTDEKTVFLAEDIRLEVRDNRIFIDAKIPMNTLRPSTKSTLPVRIEGELILRGERPVRRIYLEPSKVNGITPPSFMLEKVRRTNLYPLLSANRNFVRFIQEWDEQ